MDGHHADAVAAGGRGDLRRSVFPAAEECVQVVAAGGDPIRQIVHKGLDIRDFRIEGDRVGQAEVAEEFFRKVHEGMIAGGDVHLHAAGQEAGHGGGFLPGRSVHQRELGDEPAHGDGRLDEQGIVRHDGNPFGDQCGGDVGAFAVAADEDGDVGPFGLFTVQVPQRADDFIHLVLGEKHFYGTRGGVRDTGGLRDVGVEPLDHVAGSGNPVQLRGGIAEEGVVEIDDGAAGAPVFVQDGHIRVPEFLLQAGVQEVPVAATPTVDALLHVAHHEGFAAGGVAVLQERPEVLPLHHGRVLEFIQEEIVEPDAQFFVDERGAGAVDDAAEDGVAVVQGDDVFLPLNLGEGVPEFACDAQAVELPLDGEGGLIRTVRLAEAGQKRLQRCVQRPMKLVFQGPFSLGEPLVGIHGLAHEGLRGFRNTGRRVPVLIQGFEEAVVAVGRIHAGGPEGVQHGLRRLHHAFLIGLHGLFAEGAHPFQGLARKLVLAFREVLQAGGHLGEPAFEGESPRSAQVLLDTAGEPFQQGPVPLFRQAVQHAVHAFRHQFLAVQLHLVGGELADLARESAEGLLEELVDGGDGEGGVVMQDAGNLLLRFFLDLRLRQTGGGGQVFQIARLRRVFGQGIEFLQDTALHLVRSLVGEGDGQYMTVSVGLIAFYDKADVLFCKVVCLAGTGRCLENPDHDSTKIIKKTASVTGSRFVHS